MQRLASQPTLWSRRFCPAATAFYVFDVRRTAKTSRRQRTAKPPPNPLPPRKPLQGYALDNNSTVFSVVRADPGQLLLFSHKRTQRQRARERRRQHQQDILQTLVHDGKQFITASAMNFVQILTTPTADTPGTCLLVHHDNRRYLFGNVAEGTQRVFVQQKISLARVEHIFMSGNVDWHTAGGLLGMVLTVAEVVSAAKMAAADAASASKRSKAAARNGTTTMAARDLDIHGGENLSHFLAVARRFMFRKGLPIKLHEVRNDQAPGTNPGPRSPDWVDDNIMVWYVPVVADAPRSRKRSHEVMEGESPEQSSPKSAVAAAPPTDQELADREFIDSVVNHMFDSDWNADVLTETTLGAVQMPAKIFIADPETGKVKSYEGPMPGSPDVADPNLPVLIRRPWPAALIKSLPRTTPSRQSMCYIVKNHPRRGKVNAAEAARLGVAKPDIKKLVAGESVTAADGSTVTPEMVVAAPVEGMGFAVVEIPDRSYIGAFLARPEWADDKVMGCINTMFWIFRDKDAFEDERLQAFMRKHSTVRHTISSPETCANRLALSSAAALQVKHNRVDPDRFSLQQYNNIPSLAALPGGTSFQAARPGWSVKLAPQVIEEDDKVFSFVDLPAAIKDMDPAVLQKADEARSRIGSAAFRDAVAVSNQGLSPLAAAAEVIPLGTGSAMPSKYRNVSSTLVRVPGVGSYLYDCGENTLGSMRRLFGAEKLAEVLRDLKVLWVSHLHADHHLGTVSVMRAWRDATAGQPATQPAPRLMVASHIDMLRFLREYSDVEDFGIERVVQVSLRCPDHPKSYRCTPVVFGPKEQAEFGLERIDAVRVLHCYGAMAVSMTFADPVDGRVETSTGRTPKLKVSYSGDCRPSPDFVEIGQDSTLLIHESTFDDEMLADAQAKKHSTMGEALEVGRKMGARRVLLTHFSQRYPKIPLFGDNGAGDEKASRMEILVAFDQMRVKLGDFHEAAAYLPALQKLYEGEEKQSA